MFITLSDENSGMMDRMKISNSSNDDDYSLQRFPHSILQHL